MAGELGRVSYLPTSLAMLVGWLVGKYVVGMWWKAWVAQLCPHAPLLFGVFALSVGAPMRVVSGFFHSSIAFEVP